MSKRKAERALSYPRETRRKAVVADSSQVVKDRKHSSKQLYDDGCFQFENVTPLMHERFPLNRSDSEISAYREEKSFKKMIKEVIRNTTVRSPSDHLVRLMIDYGCSADYLADYLGKFAWDFRTYTLMCYAAALGPGLLKHLLSISPGLPHYLNNEKAHNGTLPLMASLTHNPNNVGLLLSAGASPLAWVEHKLDDCEVDDSKISPIMHELLINDGSSLLKLLQAPGVNFYSACAHINRIILEVNVRYRNHYITIGSSLYNFFERHRQELETQLVSTNALPEASTKLGINLSVLASSYLLMAKDEFVLEEKKQDELIEYTYYPWAFLCQAKRLHTRGLWLRERMSNQSGFSPPPEMSRNLISRQGYLAAILPILWHSVSQQWQQRTMILMMLLNLDKSLLWNKLMNQEFKSPLNAERKSRHRFMEKARTELKERISVALLRYGPVPLSLDFTDHILSFLIPKASAKEGKRNSKEQKLLTNLVKGRLPDLFWTNKQTNRMSMAAGLVRQGFEEKMVLSTLRQLSADTRCRKLGSAEYQSQYLGEDIARIQKFAESKYIPMTTVYLKRALAYLMQDYSEKLDLFEKIVRQGMDVHPIVFYRQNLPGSDEFKKMVDGVSVQKFDDTVILTQLGEVFVVSKGKVTRSQPANKNFLGLLNGFAGFNRHEEIALNSQLTSAQLSQLHEAVMDPSWVPEQTISARSSRLKDALVQMLLSRYRYMPVPSIAGQNELIIAIRKALSICQWGLHPLEAKEYIPGNEPAPSIAPLRSHVLLFVKQIEANHRPTGEVVFPAGENQLSLLEQFIFRDRGFNQVQKFQEFIEANAGEYIFAQKWPKKVDQFSVVGLFNQAWKFKEFIEFKAGEYIFAQKSPKKVAQLSLEDIFGNSKPTSPPPRDLQHSSSSSSSVRARL